MELLPPELWTNSCFAPRTDRVTKTKREMIAHSATTPPVWIVQEIYLNKIESQI